jgi:hypothetical protein
MKRSRTTEFGDDWANETPESAHRKLGNLWLAWSWWVLVLEESAACIARSASYTEKRKGQVTMPAVFGVRAMLMGYAIECGLKGIWVRRGHKFVLNGKYQGVGNDHNLIALAQKVGFQTTPLEADVLKRLSKFSRFAGRYPISKASEEMAPYDVPSVGKVDVGFFSKRDFRIAQSLINKVISQMSGKKRRVIPAAM